MCVAKDEAAIHVEVHLESGTLSDCVSCHRRRCFMRPSSSLPTHPNWHEGPQKVAMPETTIPHPCPTYQLCYFGHSHLPQKIPPNRQKWGPQNEFPGITRTEGCCGNSYRNPEVPGISRPIPISEFGVPIFSVLTGNEVDMLGSAEQSLSFFSLVVLKVQKRPPM